MAITLLIINVEQVTLAGLEDKWPGDTDRYDAIKGQ